MPQNLSPSTHYLSAKRGFTLIELIIVMAVLAGLAGIGMSSYPGVQKRGRDTQRRSDVKQYQTALELYANKNNGSFPVYTGDPSASGFCQTTLGLPACPDDPGGVNNYNVVTSANNYMVSARLELPPSPATYFVVCSQGTSKEATTTSCP